MLKDIPDEKMPFLDHMNRILRRLFQINYSSLLFIIMPVYLYCADPLQNITSQSAPYSPSPVINSVEWDFDNLLRMAPGSDLWPTTWAADNNIYSSWGDGGGFGGSNSDGRVSLGFSRIEGSPESFVGYNVWGGKNAENPATFKGKSPGMLSVDGVLYAWINTQNANPPDVKLAWSNDLGKNWQLTNWSVPSFGVGVDAVFLNFGKDYAGSRDNYVYIHFSAFSGVSDVWMARVPKGQLLDSNAYKFFKGFDNANMPEWTSTFAERRPVFTDINSAAHVSVVYSPDLGRYIMTAAHGDVGQLGIFDAPEPWGPWTTVAYYENWGNFSGFSLVYSFPTKWISNDGTTMWMIFSSSGELDSFNLVKATLKLDGEPPPTPEFNEFVLLPYVVN